MARWCDVTDPDSPELVEAYKSARAKPASSLLSLRKRILAEQPPEIEQTEFSSRAEDVLVELHDEALVGELDGVMMDPQYRCTLLFCKHIRFVSFSYGRCSTNC